MAITTQKKQIELISFKIDQIFVFTVEISRLKINVVKKINIQDENLCIF
jgi:hypothetical protein